MPVLTSTHNENVPSSMDGHSGSHMSHLVRRTSEQIESKKERSLGKTGNEAYKKLREKLNEYTNHEPDNHFFKLISKVIPELNSGDQQRLEGVKLFLEGGPRGMKESDVDDCVRWNLLYTAADLAAKSHNLDELNAREELSKILLERRPYLAFEYPYKGNSLDAYKTNCTSKEVHKNYKQNITPFMVAAQCGNHAVIAAMISYGKRFYNSSQPLETPSRKEFCDEGRYWPLAKILRQGVPGRVRDTEGPLMSAVQEMKDETRERVLKTLEELLKVEDIVKFKDEAGQVEHDKTFLLAIQEGMDDVVEKFLLQEPLAETFATSYYILQAFRAFVDSSKKVVKQKDKLSRRRNILMKLISTVRHPDAFNREVAEGLIEENLKDIWKAKPDGVGLTEGLKRCLLHLAVKHQRKEFVDLFLKDYPESVNKKEAVSDHEEHFPLWYNNHPQGIPAVQKDAFDVRQSIRTAIVNKMIHGTSDIESLTEILDSSDGKSLITHPDVFIMRKVVQLILIKFRTR